MNVPADDAASLALARKLDQRLLVIVHVLHRSLGFQFDVGRKRPVTEPEQSPDSVHPHVHIQNPLVKRGANAVEQPVEMGEPIELVPMQNNVTLAICRDMDRSLGQLDSAEVQAEELLKEFVVIADDK